MDNPKGAVIIACAVFRDVIQRYPGARNAAVIVMDYGLHLAPRKMRAAIQEQIDALPAPSLVLIGFGLCGNGLAGIESRCHTLVIPRIDDCVSLYLGSRAAYLEAFQAQPATYYLTPGWLECGGEPMSEHQKCVTQFGAEKAAAIADMLYGKYRNVCFVAFTPEEMDRYRPRALAVAAFCRAHWGWQYSERLGSDRLIRRLIDLGSSGPEKASSEFVIVQPGGEIRQESFMSPPITTGEDPCIFTIKQLK
jgi:hypothetical protein